MNLLCSVYSRLQIDLDLIITVASPAEQPTAVKMTLYYTLVFMLLMAEMALFMLLIVPLPFTLRRRMFTYVKDLVPFF